MLALEIRNARLRAASPSLAAQYTRACFEEVRKKVMGFRDSKNVWIESIDGSAESFAVLGS